MLDLDGIALVDQHAHGILRARPSLDEFRGLFSESLDPRQWPHVATGVTYRRAIADPSYLKPLIERFRETSFVLLHCYPYVREAGWLAHVYGNVWFDLSPTILQASGPARAIREALELAPVSKLLYASDAARTPELYYLAARWWRRALGEVLSELLPASEACGAARLILADNARLLYRL